MRVPDLWNKVWKRDHGECQHCGEKHTVGNTHTVTTLFLEEPIEWYLVDEAVLWVLCFTCIFNLRDMFRRRNEYLERRGKAKTSAEDAGKPTPTA